MAKNQKQRVAVKAGQVWEPKRGARSLRVLEVNGDTASVRKFDERSERLVDVKIKSILSDYTLQGRS